MAWILVSDIFGRTKALERFAADLPGSVEIVGPYNSELMNFDCEVEAYSHFTSKVGLDKYAEKLSERISASFGHVSLVGFSISASAIWRLSDHQALSNVSGAILFYSSQVRHYVKIDPILPTRLIFPAMEPHFSVLEVMQTLKQKEQVEVHHSTYLHGFMNPQSRNYNAEAYAKYKQIVCNTPFNDPICKGFS
ncbi:hypothetical protein [Microbulbifer sp. JMSA003]|uniref:hypothetical protein n=1 Tax=Microbulbifer sp. JMSA003 TaxID=3243369 RepID=UPI00403A3271